MIVIYDTLGAYGGSHTLMLRMGEWCNLNKQKMTIIGTSISNTDIVNKLRIANVNVVCANLGDRKEGYELIRKLIDIEPIKVFCFAWNHYLDVERIKKIYKLSFDNFVYCIHPETFKKGIGFKTSFMKKYSIRSYKSIFERMNNNNSLIFLDEVNIEESQKYLECFLSKQPKIVRLPMFCPERDDAEEVIKNGFANGVLLTAARADFPYKGYMVDLVDIFANLKKIHPEMTLQIVSSGDDIEQLKDKIYEQSDEIRSSIILHGWMEYEDLKEEMRRCKLFIGMGTTVFDSALQYKPSIAVRFNTMNCIGDSLVAERPTYMTVPLTCKESARDIIEKVYGWSFEEYRRQSFRSFNKVKEIYDIDKCMTQLIHSETRDKNSLLSSFECMRHFMNKKLNDVRFKNRSGSDFKNLQWEKKV